MNEYVWVLVRGDRAEGETIESIFKTFDDGKASFDSLVGDISEEYTKSFNIQTAERKLLMETDPNNYRYYDKLELRLTGPVENEDGNWEFGYSLYGGGWLCLNKYELK
jgi:hypothetical protein